MGKKSWLVLGGVILALILGAAAAAVVRWKDDSSRGLTEAYRLGEKLAGHRQAAYATDRKVFESLKVEPFHYRVIRDLEGTPSSVATCGVRYRVSDAQWGIVPDLVYSCEDKAAEQSALEGAVTRLRKRMDVALDDAQLRLDTREWPGTVMEKIGKELISAQVLKVPFRMHACVESVADRLAQSAVELMAVRCEIFAKPGDRVKQLRTELLDTKTRIAAKIATPPQRRVQPATEAQAAACTSAVAASDGFDAPGSTTGTATGKAVVYRIAMTAGEQLQFDLSSTSFDPLLEIRDATCKQRLARDDDSGGNRAALLKWSATTTGDQLLVVTSAMGGGTGPYSLRVSPSSKLTDSEVKALVEFVDWVSKTTDDELADAWRATAGVNFQLGCLNQARFSQQDVVHAVVGQEALTLCQSGLEAAEAARLEVVRGDGHAKPTSSK